MIDWAHDVCLVEVNQSFVIFSIVFFSLFCTNNVKQVGKSSLRIRRHYGTNCFFRFTLCWLYSMLSLLGC